MVKIKLDDRWAIWGDERCWILVDTKDNNRKMGWYNSLEVLLNDYTQKAIRLSNVEDFKQLVVELGKIKSSLKSALAPLELN